MSENNSAEQKMDAVELLIHQHRSMEDLLDKVKKEEDAGKKKSLFIQVADQLTVHIKSEEDVFYPAVNAARTEDDLRESLEEHLSLKRLLADLMELDVTDKTFEAKMKVLAEQAEHHHGEEEDDLFPAARKMLDKPRLQTLGKEMLDLQQSMQQAGEPREAVVNETDAAAPLK
jgi:hemerythrin superfamily protein